jgi:hypothetical protein
MPNSPCTSDPVTGHRIIGLATYPLLISHLFKLTFFHYFSSANNESFSYP